MQRCILTFHMEFYSVNLVLKLIYMKLKLCKKAIRSITYKSYNANINAIFKVLRIIKLNYTYKLHLGKFMYSLIHSLSPKPKLIINLLNRNLHQYQTGNQRLHVVYVRTKTVQDSFLIRGPQYWNSLPSRLMECLNNSNFLTQIRVIGIIFDIFFILSSMAKVLHCYCSFSLYTQMSWEFCIYFYYVSNPLTTP